MNKSDAKQSREELILIATGKRHNKALSIVSHDLKSPLTCILGHSKLLLDKMRANGSDSAMIKTIKRIISSGENMQSLVNDINLMVKMEAGRERVEPYWVDDLEWEMRETVKTFELQAELKHITLQVKADPLLPPVCWDMTRIRNHVLNNIISNALKFTPEGGFVALKATTVSEHILLRVEDTGPGIPPEEEEKIFDRFRQLEVMSERSFAGSGLGLHNARLFVERHGGEIFLDSSYINGAAFLIKLPLNAVGAGEPCMNLSS
ncbi:hypothetical protein MNBD_NITROSPINAE03-1590 [hydrothermal vent metagenome]|uniref:histidine kinase n=1 Tax=hydrothermal vent metagenome TaxID=652676 RepID=A0A3B1CCN3_9ZZZZ